MDAVPLVFGGQGGLAGYFTHPPGWNRPFAIINLPHTAFDNVWQWLALPHETGHDTYASVNNLGKEVEDALEVAMRSAVKDNVLTIPDVDVGPIQYSGEDFIATVWRSWANEAQADVVGLLNCGGSAAVALQQIIGFSADDWWELTLMTDGSHKDGPEVHPTPYVRNALNISALRIMDHNDLADEINTRFEALRPSATHIRWILPPQTKIAAIEVDQMFKSATIAANVLVSHTFPSLGSQSYRELGDFIPKDQQIVDSLVDPLIAGDPRFAQGKGATPRHALAATMFAFEKDRSQAATINRTFKHFVQP